LLKNMIYNNQNYIIGFVSKMFDFFTLNTTNILNLLLIYIGISCINNRLDIYYFKYHNN